MKTFKDKYNGILNDNDIKRMIRRSYLFSTCWGWETMHGLSFTWAMIPALKKIYKDKKDEYIEALKRQMSVINLTSQLSAFTIGVELALEEKNATMDDFDTSSIIGVRNALMGSLSAIGDSIFLGTLRILGVGIGVSLASKGSILGPLLYILIYNIPAVLTRQYGGRLGYLAGLKLLEDAEKSGIMEKVLQSASIVGMMSLGSMIYSMVGINISIPIGTGEAATTIGEVINGIVPGLGSLLLVLLYMFLLKKKPNTFLLLIVTIVVCIIFKYFGILA